MSGPSYMTAIQGTESDGTVANTSVPNYTDSGVTAQMGGIDITPKTYTVVPNNFSDLFEAPCSVGVSYLHNLESLTLDFPNGRVCARAYE